MCLLIDSDWRVWPSRMSSGRILIWRNCRRHRSRRRSRRCREDDFGVRVRPVVLVVEVAIRQIEIWRFSQITEIVFVRFHFSAVVETFNCSIFMCQKSSNHVFSIVTCFFYNLFKDFWSLWHDYGFKIIVFWIYPKSI